MLKGIWLSIAEWLLKLLAKFLKTVWVEKVEVPKKEEKIEEAFDQMEKAQTKEEFEKAADNIHKL